MKARGRRVPGTMNGTESAYAVILEAKRRAGHIQAYAYEAITLKLAPRTTYTPDFLVLSADGYVELHEVKGGFHRDDARVKLKVAATLFPWFAFTLATYKGKKWSLTEVEP